MKIEKVTIITFRFLKRAVVNMSKQTKKYFRESLENILLKFMVLVQFVIIFKELIFMETRSQLKNKVCGICFQKIATLGDLLVCQHSFCLKCAFTWSQTENTCPICRKKFYKIRKLEINNFYKQSMKFVENQKNDQILNIAQQGIARPKQNRFLIFVRTVDVDNRLVSEEMVSSREVSSRII